MAQSRQAGVILATMVLATTMALAEPISVSVRPVEFNPLEPSDRQAGELSFQAGFALNSDARQFGGISGLLVEADGSRAVMVTDRGRWLTARLTHDADGRLTGFTDATLAPLLGADGTPVANAGSWHYDAEAVERLGDGDLLVAFEHKHRLLRYAGADPRTDTPELLPRPPGIDQAVPNDGLEAVAPLPDGRILAVTENYRDASGAIVGWILAGRAFAPLRYQSTGIFRPTDFAALPNGDVLVLERRYTPIGGPAGRIALIPAAQIMPGALLQPRELARIEPPRIVDNYEGLAVRPAAAGGWWLYVLSDDNFNPLQRNLLLQFHWPGG